MTDQEKNEAVAGACGELDRWVLKKRGLYYQLNAGGYTSCICKAWIVPEAVADKYTYPHDVPVTKHRAPLKNYGEDLNAMADAEKHLNGKTVDVRSLYYDYLALEVPNWPKHRDEFFEHDYSMVVANAYQRRQAFLKTIGLLKD